MSGQREILPQGIKKPEDSWERKPMINWSLTSTCTCTHMYPPGDGHAHVYSLHTNILLNVISSFLIYEYLEIDVYEPDNIW